MTKLDLHLSGVSAARQLATSADSFDEDILKPRRFQIPGKKDIFDVL